MDNFIQELVKEIKNNKMNKNRYDSIKEELRENLIILSQEGKDTIIFNFKKNNNYGKYNATEIEIINICKYFKLILNFTNDNRLYSATWNNVNNIFCKYLISLAKLSQKEKENILERIKFEFSHLSNINNVIPLFKTNLWGFNIKEKDLSYRQKEIINLLREKGLDVYINKDNKLCITIKYNDFYKN